MPGSAGSKYGLIKDKVPIKDLKEIVKAKAQSQASLREQLRVLYQLANQEGLYDAADFIQRHLEKE